ncbi:MULTISPECIES: MarR family winged helix-turn-helix transcriptional regulator [Oleiagrimonas]|uniref:Winged helix-turn-helix transcriptional regulator n=1 Tax=Oleiagrimonas citrea TaxID=1665687 RepID=A0A846ZN87_9GAMM|nr:MULTISPECIES: MarR family winged helix-turn-helix transcriptional regulator [Oleiagrimonas]NKZ39476.1 winged helix-turn-helix transcriptional regulator [Oleiagrimonas citrea]RAP59552.1 hypothetical protein BTJ49_02560 [Oleiagrimonas sp. MCCC 1A03011]
MSSTPPGDALHRLLHAYKRAMREAYRAAGIDLPSSHVRTLKAICGLPKCTAQAIAERMHRDKSQITRVVHDLQAAGLITRRPDPDDGRRQLLAPTASGKRLRARVAEAEREAGTRMVRGLPPTSVATFVRMAETMAANLDTTES